MSLTLSKRACKMAGKLNPRTEFHGEDRVGACDFTLSEMMLDASEINELFGDEGMHARLFKLNGELPESALAYIDTPLAFNRKFHKGKVTLRIGPDQEKLVLGNAKIGKITLDPQTGGLTLTTLQVQCNPDSAELAKLYEHMTEDMSVSVSFGREEVKAKKDQPELPLQHEGQGTPLDSAGEPVIDQPALN